MSSDARQRMDYCLMLRSYRQESAGGATISVAHDVSRENQQEIQSEPRQGAT
jgi:hypothetical protein